MRYSIRMNIDDMLHSNKQEMLISPDKPELTVTSPISAAENETRVIAHQLPIPAAASLRI